MYCKYLFIDVPSLTQSRNVTTYMVAEWLRTQKSHQHGDPQRSHCGLEKRTVPNFLAQYLERTQTLDHAKNMNTNFADLTDCFFLAIPHCPWCPSFINQIQASCLPFLYRSAILRAVLSEVCFQCRVTFFCSFFVVVSFTFYISRVSDQNGISLQSYIVEIHHSGWKPSISIRPYFLHPAHSYVCFPETLFQSLRSKKCLYKSIELQKSINQLIICSLLCSADLLYFKRVDHEVLLFTIIFSKQKAITTTARCLRNMD